MSINANVIKNAVVNNNVITKADLSFTNPQQSYDFLVDTIARAGTLSKLPYMIKSVPSGNIDALTVAGKKLRERGAVSTLPVGTDNITERQIPFAVKSCDFDIWLDNDQMYYYAAREASGMTQQPDLNNAADLQALVVSAEQKMLAMDMQDLMFNGCKTYQTGQADTDFYKIIDGFVQQLSKSPNKVDNAAKAFDNLDIFWDTVATLPEETTSNFNDDVKWFMNRKTYNKVRQLVSKRGTNQGDATLINGELMELCGYKIVVPEKMLGYLKTPETLTDGRIGIAILTPMQNLVPVSTKNPAIEYKAVDNDTVAIKKGATYHNWKVYLDAIVRSIKDSAILVGENI